MIKEHFSQQLDDIINEYAALKSSTAFQDFSGNQVEHVVSLVSKAKASVARITGYKSDYYKDIEEHLSENGLNIGNKLRRIMGTIIALKEDLDNNYLKNLSEIIQSEVFSDYLEMSEHLLEQGYKDPAAVIIGSTLEIHLRELCISNEIELEYENTKGDMVPIKADKMNIELAKADVYSKAYQKQVVAWLGLRNSAAHGKYSEYTAEEIKLMLQGVRQFILLTK